MSGYISWDKYLFLEERLLSSSFCRNVNGIGEKIYGGDKC
ncbi:hypothetical protein SAMD00020551_3824 [Mesobacillus selenatarsenatis SF-1]|uniref:Uncharacterized protein n=1 Tax=Mesobacillus selenatarsenatis (strain DSM 18680 / JCM 14380 / FERM P-15431 / SF-1) TaxID=1321606 RepID=A0A0A8X9F8_MESS1|nr:hypothetical protein SAMD00020551_3824 [Mesobacillus selenatarsenatis SF-1]